MTSSADVAARAGVSRSTVSQILNGHGYRFTAETVDLVRSTAQEMGYRPSVAGRSLVRGTSDIVLTLIPDITFGPRLRELIDRVTHELAPLGYTNLLRLSSPLASLEDAVLGLRPYGVFSVAPLSSAEHERLRQQGVHVVEQSRELQQAIDKAIGATQAEHLASMGYSRIAAALPTEAREEPFANARVAGVHEWCSANGVDVLPDLHIDLAGGSAHETARLLPAGRAAVACYNDEVALAVLSAAQCAGRAVPDEIGVIGVDNSMIARIANPTLTTVDIDLTYSSHEIVKALLEGASALPADPLGEVAKQLRVVPGSSTARAT